MHVVFLFHIGLVTLITVIPSTEATKYNFKERFQRGASEIFSIWRKNKNIISNNSFTVPYASSSTLGKYTWKPYQRNLGDSTYFPKKTPLKFSQNLFPFGWKVNKVGSQSETGMNPFTGLSSMPMGWNIGERPSIFGNLNNPFNGDRRIPAPSPFLTEGNLYMKSAPKVDIQGLHSLGKSIINSIMTNYIKNNNVILRTDDDDDSREIRESSNDYQNGTKVTKNEKRHLKEAEKMKDLRNANTSTESKLSSDDSFQIELINNDSLLLKSVAVHFRRKGSQEIVLILFVLWFL